MLTKRQQEILSILDNNKSYIKGMELASEVGCSLKTLQNEIKELKIILHDYEIDIESTTGKGYHLCIHNDSLYMKLKSSSIETKDFQDFNNQSFRITYILAKLLMNNDYIKADHLSEDMYISRSSVSGDIKIVKKILEKYHLSIEHKPNYGMKVIGAEKDKRNCIIKEQLGVNAGYSRMKKEMISVVTDIVVDILMSTKYRISDVVLQNLVLHICVSVQRMVDGIYIEQKQYIYKYAHEQEIARKILEKLSNIYNFEIVENEILYLALYLLGKKSYEENDLISLETDQFINDMLNYIKLKNNIDFYGDVELKISLALHCVPLFIRLENHMQLQNTMIQDIRVNFPLAYDVAVIAASYISQEKGFVLSEDEIAYLAVHFSLSLSKKENKNNPKRVLIICNARRGDRLMIQHTFLKQFNDMVSDLEIMNALEIPYVNIDEYDCVFTTFLNHPSIPSRAIRINFFIDDKDIRRIKRALLGESETSELLKYFKEEYFMGVIEAKNKEDVIRQMCQRACLYNDFDENLYDACIRREELGTTAYGHRIALPHPDSLISHQTIVVTAILKKPILWNDEKVQLIFLICVKRENHKDLRILFECISKLMMNDQSISDIIYKPNYQMLIQNIERMLG